MPLNKLAYLAYVSYRCLFCLSFLFYFYHSDYSVKILIVPTDTISKSVGWFLKEFFPLKKYYC